METVPMLNFVWSVILCADAQCLLLSLYVRVKNWMKSMQLCQLQHNDTCDEYLRKLGNEYLNPVTCKLCAFSTAA